MAVDIGYDAINRSSTSNPGNTVVLLNQVATVAGVVETVEIWAYNNMGGVRVGTFARSNYICTPRDSHYIGTVYGGAKRTYSGLSIAVEVGDCIGIYWSSGYLDAVWSSWASFYKAGNQFSAGAQTYAVLSHMVSLGGYIVEPSARSWGGIIG